MHILRKISERIYCSDHCEKTDRPVIGVIRGDKKVLLVDSGNSARHNYEILSLMRDVNLPEPDYCVLTHWHWDHVFGASCLNALLIAHEITCEKLGAMKDLNWDDESLDERVRTGEEIEFCASAIKLEFPDRNEIDIRLPDLIFRDSIAIDLGNLFCEIIHVGGDHSPDSTVVYVPAEKVLFLGDSIYENLYASPERYTASGVAGLIGKLAKLNADTYIESHTVPKSHTQEWEYLELLGKMAELSSGFGSSGEFIEYLRREKPLEIDEDSEELAMLFTKWKET